MIYLHESPIRYHGALHTGNCLVDSRWVVKLSDFGLREFKKGAEDPSLKDPNKIREKCYSMYLNTSLYLDNDLDNISTHIHSKSFFYLK